MAERHVWHWDRERGLVLMGQTFPWWQFICHGRSVMPFKLLQVSLAASVPTRFWGLQGGSRDQGESSSVALTTIGFHHRPCCPFVPPGCEGFSTLEDFTVSLHPSPALRSHQVLRLGGPRDSCLPPGVPCGCRSWQSMMPCHMAPVGMDSQHVLCFPL